MQFRYHNETDSLYVEILEHASAKSQELAPGVVLDFDAQGGLVGIDIDHASKVSELSHLKVDGIPLSVSYDPGPNQRVWATDVNQDGIVNEADLHLVFAGQGAKRGDPGYKRELDVNGDGVIDIRDIAIVGADFGRVEAEDLTEEEHEELIRGEEEFRRGEWVKWEDVRRRDV
ncbi:MAG: DUF2283 domain-containing protein [Dehalococcoidia bacterium]